MAASSKGNNSNTKKRAFSEMDQDAKTDSQPSLVTRMTSEYKSNEREIKQKNESLKSFISSVHASYPGFESEVQEDEAAAPEKHNDAMRQLFDVCCQVQRSDKLSLTEKLSQLQLLADPAYDLHDEVLSFHADAMCFELPAELRQSNDASTMVASALKQHHPSRAQIREIVAAVHSGKLDLSNAMHVMIFTMHHGITHSQINAIARVFNSVSKVIGLSFYACPIAA